MPTTTTFSIGIRTVPRPTAHGANYCRRTVDRLFESGTLSNPDVLGLHISNGTALTPNENGAAALRMAVNDSPDFVLFLEDDIDLIDDLIPSLTRWLDRFATPDLLFYPLSCFYPSEIERCLDIGAWTTYRHTDYYGSQGFVMRPIDALNFATWVTNLDELPYRVPITHGVSFDLHLAYWHRLMKPDITHFTTPAPCFLDHIGEYSAIGPPGSWERVGRVESFPGRDYQFHAKEPK